MRPRVVAAIAAAAALLVALAFGLRPPALPAAPIVRGTAVEAVYASGTIEPVQRAEVRARAGGPLIELRVREGDAVRSGELLARIDAPVLGFELARGRADRDAARMRKESAPQLTALRAQEQGLIAQVDQARAEVGRAEELVRTGVKPPAELERARTQLTSLQSQLDSNRAQQGEASLLLDADLSRSSAGAATLAARAGDAEVRAPMDGTVLVRRVERGETVVPNQSLLRIGDLSHLHVEAQVDEADVGRVFAGTPALLRLAAFDEQPLSGTVARVAPEGDRERKSFEVDIDLTAAPPGLRPGMTVEVNLLTRRHEHALLVPTEALPLELERRPGAPVTSFVRVLRQGRAVRVPVEVGIRDLAHVEVQGKLREGELVLLGNTQLADGARARPLLLPAAPP